MKTIILLLIILIGLVTWSIIDKYTILTYYPEGTMGSAVPYFSSTSPLECYKCKGDTYLYKVDSKKRIICDSCFRKLRKTK